jgi:glycosyltransferase involved in cell wall biosynthesis
MAKDKIAFCAIVNDNLKNVTRMLNSIEGFFDECVLLDTGCDNNVAEYLKKKSTKYDKFNWVGDFALARNYNLSMANSDWIFYLDSDEEASPFLMRSMDSLINSSNIEGYKIPRIHYYGETRPLRDYWKHLRLFRSNAEFVGAVHESIKNLKNIKELSDFDLAIRHYNSRVQQKEKSQKYSKDIKKKIREAEHEDNKGMLEYYKYKLWVQDNVYLLETDPDVDQKLLNQRYKEYRKYKKEIESKRKEEGWKIK